MAKRTLSDERIKDAERLKKIWLSFKAEIKAKGGNVTQDDVALACGWTTQGAFSSYANANAPLNLEAVIKLANYFKVAPSDISPELAKGLELKSSNHIIQVSERFTKFTSFFEKIEKLEQDGILLDADFKRLEGMFDATLNYANVELDKILQTISQSEIEAQKTA